MTRTLLLLRHGQTAWNAEGRAQGQTDVSLDETGHEQARRAAPAIAAHRPSRLWSSDLSRAHQTATYVAEATGLEVTLEAAFREFAVGDSRVGLTLAEFERDHPREHADLLAGRAVPGRESHADVVERFVPALDKVAADIGEGECGVVVSHGGAMRTAIAAFLGLPPEAREVFGGLGNCHWVELVESVPSFSGGELRWRLRAWNRAAPPDFTAPPAIG